MKQNENLKTKIWLYLSLLSILILIFLWVFQILFINTFYEGIKTNDLNNSIEEIEKFYGTDYFLVKMDDISKNNGVCLQITISNNVEYNSIAFNRGCISDTMLETYKIKFMDSNLDSGTIKLTNTKFNNDVLVKAIKLDSETYAFASVSLQPLDSTIFILRKQLIIVSFVVLFLAFIIGYFISKRISIPIEKINKSVKELSKGNYKVKFETNENIKEINELVNNLNIATQELNKTEELRNELLANVSHDLKTPLTMIKAYSEMVRDMTYNNKEKREANLNVIIDETDRLNSLVNDIIELSKLQTGFVELNKENFDLVVLIKNIIKKFDILNYNIVFEHFKDSIIINADRKRIEQVIYNLISNAVKFTGSDKKVIIKIENSNNKILVSISDTGKGIEQKDIKFIWDRYYKADKSYKRSSTGSGIGLSIVKNIFIKYGYEYGVNSTKNKGSTFYFIIPLQ